MREGGRVGGMGGRWGERYGREGRSEGWERGGERWEGEGGIGGRDKDGGERGGVCTLYHVIALTNRNTVHRDLAARNILVHKNSDGSMQAKVADFGLSR